MNKIKIIWLLSILLIKNGFTVIPTIDTYQQATDNSTSVQYGTQIATYLEQLSSTMNAAEQVQNLKGLAEIQGAGAQICSLCDKSDLITLNKYSSDINTDLCSQFAKSLTNITGTKESISRLQDIMTKFATNPKAAGLALQQAAIATQTATQNTMAQMQLLQAQAQQRELAKEKLQQQSTMNAFGSGFHSGL